MTLTRRRAARTLLAGLALAGVAAWAQAPAAPATQPMKVLPNQAAQPLKVLRYAFLIAETTFDPPQITDLYSRTVVSNIFEAPLEFEYLARPARMRPSTLVALPEVSADYKTFTFRI